MKHIIYIALFFLCCNIVTGQASGGYILMDGSGFGTTPIQESLDRHWWNTNLSCSGTRVHDANGFRSTVNELGGWDLFSGTGVVHSCSLRVDSLQFLVQTTGTSADINLIARDDIYLAAGLSTQSYISLEHDKLTIG